MYIFKFKVFMRSVKNDSTAPNVGFHGIEDLDSKAIAFIFASVYVCMCVCFLYTRVYLDSEYVCMCVCCV